MGGRPLDFVVNLLCSGGRKKKEWCKIALSLLWGGHWRKRYERGVDRFRNKSIVEAVFVFIKWIKHPLIVLDKLPHETSVKRTHS